MTTSRSIILTILLTLAFVARVAAQVDIVAPDLSQSTKIAPDYFGPNALPIPDMLDGTTSDCVTFELAADYFDGHRGDKTYDVAMKLVVPLYTPRVNLSVWVQAITEWYEMSPESREHSRVGDDIASTGYEFGDAYISTDIHLVEGSATRPDVTLRVGLKTALGYGFFKARYFDNPGYFFDSSVSKAFEFNSPTITQLRLVATLGFLCWQTDNGRQNDAVMYGVQAKVQTKWFLLTESFGGYSGWEADGDCPMSIKSSISRSVGRYRPYVQHQYGLRDYPYSQYRIGIEYKF